VRRFNVIGEIEVIVSTTLAGEDRIMAERRARETLEMMKSRINDLSPHLVHDVNVRVGVVKEVKPNGINVNVEKRVVAKRLFKVKKLNVQSFDDFLVESSRRVKNDVMMALLIFREAEMNCGSEISFEKGFKRASSKTNKMQFLEFADLFGSVAARTEDVKIEECSVYGGPKFVLKETINLMIAAVNKRV